MFKVCTKNILRFSKEIWANVSDGYFLIMPFGKQLRMTRVIFILNGNLYLFALEHLVPIQIGKHVLLEHPEAPMFFG